MKISADHLTKQLTKPQALYWISGDETLLVNEACDQIRHFVQQHGYTERQIQHTDSHFNWSDLLGETRSLSLFSQRRIIELHTGSQRLSEAHGKILQQVIEQPSSDVILILISAKLDQAMQQTHWFKTLERSSLLIQCWPVTREQFPQWLTQRLAKFKLVTHQQGLQLLTEHTMGNLLAAAQTIEKLWLTYGNSQLSIEQIEQVISDHSHFIVFDFTDSALAGEFTKLPHILTKLRQNGTEPAIILWALVKEIRMLASLKYYIERNLPHTQLWQQWQVWDRRKPLVQSALARYPSQLWQKLLQYALTIDQVIKGDTKGNIWTSLLDLGCAIANNRYQLPNVWNS